MRKLFLLVFFSSILICSVNSQSSLSDEILSELKVKGKLVQNFMNEDVIKLKYTPDNEYAKMAVKSWTSSEKPRFTNESLFYVKKSDLLENSSDKTHCDTSIDGVSKIIRSVSKMKGMQYWSNGDQKWETLYHQSHLVDSLEKKNPIPDDLEGSAEGKSFYCIQVDNSFGLCVYGLKYYQNENSVYGAFTNVEDMKYGPVKSMKSGNLKINFVFIDEGEYILLYAFVQTTYPHIPMLEGRLLKSFNNRVVAVFDWFTKSF